MKIRRKKVKRKSKKKKKREKKLKKFPIPLLSHLAYPQKYPQLSLTLTFYLP
jgi:hypothetical protein